MALAASDPDEGVAAGGVGFAELVAELSLSYADERNPQRLPLVEQIVAGAMALIPGVIAAAVETMDRKGRLTAPVVVGDEVGRWVMDAQNRLGDGPCLRALRSGQQVAVSHLTFDSEWRAFAKEVRLVGVESVLCTPMTVNGQSLGVLTLVSSEPGFGDPEDDVKELARVFAAHAGLALSTAAKIANLSTALSSRDVIGQAKGILMERFRVTPDAAFALLIRVSSLTNIKLRIVCETLSHSGELPGYPGAHPHLAEC